MAFFRVFVLVIMGLLSFPALCFEAKVISVYDGDSLKVLNELSAVETIRIFRIDSPERKSFNLIQ